MPRGRYKRVAGRQATWYAVERLNRMICKSISRSEVSDLIYRDIDFTILSKIMSLGSRKFWMRSCMLGGSTSIVWGFCLRFKLQVCELVITRWGTQWFNHSSCTRMLEACRLLQVRGTRNHSLYCTNFRPFWRGVNQLMVHQSISQLLLLWSGCTPSWGVLGNVYTKEEISGSTIAPVLWLQLLFVPLEVPLALFCSKDLSTIAPVFWWQLLFIPVEVLMAWKICQQIAPVLCYLFIMPSCAALLYSFSFLLSLRLFSHRSILSPVCCLWRWELILGLLGTTSQFLVKGTQ